jgi:PAS domain S-box-containing protein
MALDGVIANDEKRSITSWNQQMEKIFGYSSQRTIGHKTGNLIAPSRYRVQPDRGMERFLENAQGPILDARLESVSVHRDGHEVPIELAITSLKMRRGYIFSLWS